MNTNLRYTPMVSALVVSIALLTTPFSTHATTQPDTVFSGETLGDFFGRALSGAGDVNNDGFADFIVGARGYDATAKNVGRAYVYSGQTNALLYVFTGEVEHMSLGHSVSSAGDVNLDGFDDLLIGANGTVAGNGASAGRAFVYSGQTGERLYTFVGEAFGDNFGGAVSGAGDVNNDGFPDLIVGAPTNDAAEEDAGRAYVYSGQNGALLYTFTGEANRYNSFGWSVSGAGDVNNDGFADVIVGAWYFAVGGNITGRAYVYSGQTGSLLYTFTGTEAQDHLGGRVSGAGDVNSDGFADVMVTAFGHGSVDTSSLLGIVYVYSGQTGEILYTLNPEETGNTFGGSISSIDDVNNDGTPDILVGAPRNNLGGINAPRAYVYSGRSGALLKTFAPDNELDLAYGASIAGIGDINNDGHPDLIFSSSEYVENAPVFGRANLFLLGSICCDPAGDANNDGSFNIADVTFAVARIFSAGPAPICQDRADANGDNTFNIADVTYSIARIFGGGPTPICGATGN